MSCAVMNRISTRKSSIRNTSSASSKLAKEVAALRRGDDLLICYDEVFSAQTDICEARRQMNRRHFYLLGRILLSSIFLVSAIGKLTDWSGNVQAMADKGLPLVPYFLGVALG